MDAVSCFLDEVEVHVSLLRSMTTEFQPVSGQLYEIVPQEQHVLYMRQDYGPYNTGQRE